MSGDTPTQPQFHLAQYNVARLVASLDDPRIADFVAALDRINTLGDRSPGFVWRLKTEDGTSTSVRINDDEQVLVNFTVWESVEALFEYAYHSDHAEVFRRRREWFEAPAQPYLVLWWIRAGHTPTLEEAEERLAHLREFGATPQAFSFKQRFGPPDA
jgi:GH15 family glucan-1,4-alpha-glucosidase